MSLHSTNKYGIDYDCGFYCYILFGVYVGFVLLLRKWYIHNSYMGTHGMPDINIITLSPRACGPCTYLGVYNHLCPCNYTIISGQKVLNAYFKFAPRVLSTEPEASYIMILHASCVA